MSVRNCGQSHLTLSGYARDGICPEAPFSCLSSASSDEVFAGHISTRGGVLQYPGDTYRPFVNIMSRSQLSQILILFLDCISRFPQTRPALQVNFTFKDFLCRIEDPSSKVGTVDVTIYYTVLTVSCDQEGFF